jgi:cytochrome b subunit of formate dehydrogenase
MSNLFWPRALSADVGRSGWIGRTVHWTGVVLAVLFLLTAFGFAVDGWAMQIAAWLAAAAVAMALGARGVRYLLARE